MREIAVVTIARSDFGIYFPILKEIQKRNDLKLKIIVSGMHLSPKFGMTVTEVEREFEVFHKIDSLYYSEDPDSVGNTIAQGTKGFTDLFFKYKPDILLTLGDRFDMLPAVLAAFPFQIPIAHLHGGELTLGNIDDTIRHMISKAAHIHFASSAVYANRLSQLGEEPWRIHVTGAPGLDTIRETKVWDLATMKSQFGIDISEPYLLTTFHPVTLELENTKTYIKNLLSSFEKVNRPVVFTYPNADSTGSFIIEAINDFADKNENIYVIKNAGQVGYLSLMAHADAMVGNSSSGIIEAASYRLPVVNIGNRQEGRMFPENIIQCGYSSEQISQAILKATSEKFKVSLKSMMNPYGDGRSAPRIVDILSSLPLNPQLTAKRFNDIAVEGNFKEPWL